jgi:hypothetical protein
MKKALIHVKGKVQRAGYRDEVEVLLACVAITIQCLWHKVAGCRDIINLR